MSTKTADYRAGEQNIYAYQAAHKISTLAYAIRNILQRKGR